ncbi:MAG: formylglycine-generating enzyme family protein [Bacteroidales bacterium]|nr:formylglycine-generating enzyme family protein [Bacteroidales bacterium]
MEIATKKNLDDILKRFGKMTVNVNNVAIEMIFVKGYRDFYIGKYPVTQAQWQAVMDSNPSYFKGADNPVECVSWNNCQDFVKKLNSKTGRKFRLPKEAEWEYAARGGNRTNNYTYSGSNNLDEVGWFSVNSDRKTHPVGQKKPNELGIYDMSGNVWEWCGDTSGSYRVVRGGSWIYGDSFCAVSCRSIYDPDNRYSYSGFRLVMDA